MEMKKKSRRDSNGNKKRSNDSFKKKEKLCVKDIKVSSSFSSFFLSHLFAQSKLSKVARQVLHFSARGEEGRKKREKFY